MLKTFAEETIKLSYKKRPMSRDTGLPKNDTMSYFSKNHDVDLLLSVTTNRARRFLDQHSSVFSLHTGISSP